MSFKKNISAYTHKKISAEILSLLTYYFWQNTEVPQSPLKLMLIAEGKFPGAAQRIPSLSWKYM